MSALDVILIVVGGLIVLPVIAYLVMKFGTAGFFRARDRHLSLSNKQQTKKEDDEK